MLPSPLLRILGKQRPVNLGVGIPKRARPKLEVRPRTWLIRDPVVHNEDLEISLDRFSDFASPVRWQPFQEELGCDGLVFTWADLSDG